jgi:hypothetical protein
VDRIDSIIATINSIESVDDEAELRQLDQALQELFQSAYPECGMDALFGVFERFPQSDGYGVFWTVLHGLESLPNYEPHLIESVRSQPMEFTITMVNRLLNGGTTEVNGTDLLALLEEVAANPNYWEAVREQARECAERQRRRR